MIEDKITNKIYDDFENITGKLKFFYGKQIPNQLGEIDYSNLINYINDEFILNVNNIEYKSGHYYTALILLKPYKCEKVLDVWDKLKQKYEEKRNA